MSTSRIVRDYLAKQERGFTYSVDSLYDLLHTDAPEITKGGISGFSSKAADAGFLARIPGSVMTYSLLGNIAEMKVRNMRSNGGAVGRKSSHTVYRAPTVKSVQDRLLELAAELERARTPLADYSTDDLLSELMRRNSK